MTTILNKTIFSTRTILNLVIFSKLSHSSDYATLVDTFPLLIILTNNGKRYLVLTLNPSKKRTSVSRFYRKVGPQWIERSTGSCREDTWSRKINACHCQPGSILFQRRFSKIIWWTQKITGWKQRVGISKEAKGKIRREQIF